MHEYHGAVKSLRHLLYVYKFFFFGSVVNISYFFTNTSRYICGHVLVHLLSQVDTYPGQSSFLSCTCQRRLNRGCLARRNLSSKSYKDKLRLHVIKIPYQTQDTEHNTTQEKQSVERDTTTEKQIFERQNPEKQSVNSYAYSTDIFVSVEVYLSLFNY